MNRSDPNTRRVLFAHAPTWPLHGNDSSRAIEAAAMQGLPPHTLMSRAGTAVARLAFAVAPHARRVWVAAGPGNNGGDGLRAAAVLQAAGRHVEVSLLGDAAKLPDDAHDALKSAQDAGVAIRTDPQPGAGFDLAIDALLGLGSSRPLEGAIADAARALNAGDAPVLAVDIPSGLDAALGRVTGPVAVRAAHTLTLLTLKPGLFTGAGRDQAGVVWFDTLGTETCAPADAWLFGRDPVDRLLPRRHHAQNKGSFGDVLVVGGAPGTTGAVWLASRAALCAGAGRVYVDALAGDTSHDEVPELMCKPGASSHSPDMLAKSTVTCGCGGGKAVADVLPTLLMHSARLVLDADALNAIATDKALQTLLIARRASGKPTLLTPHPLEAARLLSSSAQADARSVQHDRLAAANTLARRFQCAVLLKGSGSICAAPDLPPIINPTGNALLSTAGTGDVLAGWAGGLWAQQPDDGPAGDAVHRLAQSVGAAAAWLHGHAADIAKAAGRTAPLTASALIDALTAELSGPSSQGG